MTTEPLWKTEEVSKLLGVSCRLVQRMATEGDLPSVRVGKFLRFSPEAVRQWLESKGKHP